MPTLFFFAIKRQHGTEVCSPSACSRYNTARNDIQESPHTTIAMCSLSGDPAKIRVINSGIDHSALLLPNSFKTVEQNKMSY